MSDQSLPAPSNHLVTVINSVIDTLIKGLGVDVAYALAVAEFPFLNLPIVNQLFKLALNYLADSLDTTLKVNADIIVIRFQNDIRKAEYDKSIEPLKKPGATDADIKAAKDAIDKLIHRAH
jgi:hypothetical protein